jgi:acetyl-CoA carboxylase carboxyl transferase subunit beta
LKFKDSIKYSDRIVKYTKKSGFKDAIRCFSGSMGSISVQLAVMDFDFMGGSVGSVVGEKFCRAVMRAVDAPCPMIAVSCSGGMRMQEGIFSLMQMAKSAAILTKLSAIKQPYISILTNPTTGGTTASFAMLGDINIAEPGALIGFAGPRVIKQTIGQDLPEGFQSSDFVMEHGFMDMIVERKDLKTRIATLLEMLGGKASS